jgi:hypothetical protein
VCERWHLFKNFYTDMGDRPDGMTLERKDPEGHYEPNNCEWADRIAQGNNKRNQAKWLIDGTAMTARQVQRHWKISPRTSVRILKSMPLHSGQIPKWHDHYRKDFYVQISDRPEA